MKQEDLAKNITDLLVANGAIPPQNANYLPGDEFHVGPGVWHPAPPTYEGTYHLILNALRSTECSNAPSADKNSSDT